MIRLSRSTRTAPWHSPPQDAMIRLLAWLLVGVIIGYAALIPYAAAQSSHWQYLWGQAHSLVFVGNALILIVALRRMPRQQSSLYRWACSLLLVAHVLTVAAAAFDVTSYQSGPDQSVASWSMALYVLIYTSHTFALAVSIPVSSFPRIHILRLGADTALVLALSDTALRLLLPLLVRDWTWTDTLSATELRLVTSIGISFWYVAAYRRFGNFKGRAVRFWGLGLVFMIATDVLFLYASYRMTQGASGFLLGTAMPLWDLHQLCWALGFFYGARTIVRWHAAPITWTNANTAPWRWMLRPLALLAVLGIVGSGLVPSPSILVALIATFVTREALAWYEREQLIRHEQAHSAALAAANQQLLAYTAQAEEFAAARERERVAAELHDHLGHALTAMNMQLNLADRALQREQYPKVAASIGQIRALIQDALAGVRRVVATASTAPAASLHEALTALAQTNSDAGIRTTLTIAGTPPTLPAVKEDALMRAVQESLTNVRKHADAHSVAIHLDARTPTVVRLTIRDDGCGSAGVQTGHGLRTMQRRIAGLGGTLEIDTAPDTGFALVIEMPV